MPRKKTRRLIIALFALGIAVFAMTKMDEYAAEYQVESEAAAARAAQPATLTPDQARDWLTQHGYSVILWNPQDPRGFVGSMSDGRGQYLTVAGERQFWEGTVLLRSKWIFLEIRFNQDGTFNGVQARPLSAPIDGATTLPPRS